MKFSIAQIGKNRLKKVLVNDKQNNPESLCEVLKFDIMNVLNCYVDNPNIEIKPLQTDSGIVFDIQIKCSRIKSFGVLS